MEPVFDLFVYLFMYYFRSTLLLYVKKNRKIDILTAHKIQKTFKNAYIKNELHKSLHNVMSITLFFA